MGNITSGVEFISFNTMIDMECLKELLNDNEKYHSNFQIDHFITARSGGTIYGMYKQSIRELHGRYEGLKNDLLEMRLLNIDINELECETNNNRLSNWDKERSAIELIRKKMEHDSRKRSMHHRMREFIRFYYQALALKKRIGPITDIRKEELDQGMWLYKLRLMAYIDLITTGRVGNGVFENILSLKKDDREAIIQDINEPGKLIAFFDKNKIDIPEYDTNMIEMEEIRKMIDVDIGRTS